MENYNKLVAGSGAFLIVATLFSINTPVVCGLAATMLVSKLIQITCK